MQKRNKWILRTCYNYNCIWNIYLYWFSVGWLFSWLFSLTITAWMSGQEGLRFFAASSSPKASAPRPTAASAWPRYSRQSALASMFWGTGGVSRSNAFKKIKISDRSTNLVVESKTYLIFLRYKDIMKYFKTIFKHNLFFNSKLEVQVYK